MEAVIIKPKVRKYPFPALQNKSSYYDLGIGGIQ
jgi:hypothetical protein